MRIFDRSSFASPGSYILYQEEATTEHLLPLFKSHKVPLNQSILDVGCGKGGCAITLAAALSVKVVGILRDELLVGNMVLS
jgi:cyclopropane fatty-acyl-phospholipid synthase-like methyltransferase